MNGLLTFEIKDGWSHENFKVNFEKVTNQLKKNWSCMKSNHVEVVCQHLKNNQSSHTHTFKPKKKNFFF